MIPKSNSAYRVPLHSLPRRDLLAEKINAATLDLRNAVAYANENEMSMLVDRAISNGANINHFEEYGNHLMVVAVRSKQPYAIPILLARGLLPPFVPEHGTDILMEAAGAGENDLIDKLITMAGMDVFSADTHGKTALHHAVINGTANSVKILLEFGADPNACTLSMPYVELCSVFGDDHQLTGSNITPLEIAAAKGNDDIIKNLLAAGADPLLGAITPLVLASKKGHVSVITLLLAHQSSTNITDEHRQTMLCKIIESGCSLNCLRLITAEHCLANDDGTLSSPLGAAIQTSKASTVALLLGCGATIEKYDTEEYTVWDDAFAKENKLWELLDLLVTRNPLPNVTAPDHSEEDFLIHLFSNCQNIIPLASFGFYPSLIETSRDTLERLLMIERHSTIMEKKLLTAFTLSTHLPKLLINENLELLPNVGNEADIQWLNLTSEKRKEQKNYLQTEVDKFLQHQQSKLLHALSFDYFISCEETCPKTRSLKNFMANKLRIDIGVPDQISESIARAWSQAAQWCIDWKVSLNSVGQSNQFVMRLAGNLLQVEFATQDFSEEDLSNHCMNLITNEIANANHPFQSFCLNPIAWLRKFENRHNLRPVDTDALSKSIQIELGLPTSTCRSIAHVWAETINLARRSTEWKTPADLEQLIANSFAPQIEECLLEVVKRNIVPPVSLKNLSLWCERTKIQNTQQIALTEAPSPARESRKRPPSGDPEGTPPVKEARI